MTTQFLQAIRAYESELADAKREVLSSVPEDFCEMAPEARQAFRREAERRIEERRRAAFRAVRAAREAERTL